MGLKGITHRDIHTHNLLFPKSHADMFNIQIGDFGDAAFIADCEQVPFSLSKPYHGTPGYIAPELLMGQKPTLKTDIFSIGAILYKIVTMRNLFKGPDLKTIIRKNRECNHAKIESKLKHCTPDCRDLIL